jgi:hypothetical protein
VIKHAAQAEMTNHVYESMSSYQIPSKIGPDSWMLSISAILSSYIILPNSKTSHPPYLSPVCLFISFAHPHTSLTCPLSTTIMTHNLKIHATDRIMHEGCIVSWMRFRSQTRRAVASPARLQRRGVELSHLLTICIAHLSDV